MIDTHALSSALSNAVLEYANPKFTRKSGNKILFNGFWRAGDKQNVCAWLDSATWHDAKTGEGGGCKEFAQIAFGMNLPDFLHRFGSTIDPVIARRTNKTDLPNSKKYKCIHSIWNLLQKNKSGRHDKAATWLFRERGFFEPRANIGSGFTNLANEDAELFDINHVKLIKQRLSIGDQMIVPIRNVHSDRVVNFFIRTISEAPKHEKSRLLPGHGGWTNEDGTPRAFGFPHLVHDFPNLVICEGMADYFAAEYMLLGEEKYLPIGAPSASSLPKWATWLKETKYEGRVIWVYQRGTCKTRCNHFCANANTGLTPF